MSKKICSDPGLMYKKIDDSIHFHSKTPKDHSTRISKYVRSSYLHLLCLCFLLFSGVITYTLINFGMANFVKTPDKIFIQPNYPRIILLKGFPDNDTASAKKITEKVHKDHYYETENVKHQIFNSNSLNNDIHVKKQVEDNFEDETTTLPSDDYDDEATTLPSDVDYDDESDYESLEQGKYAELQILENVLKHIFESHDVFSGGKNAHYIINHEIDEEDQASVHEPLNNEHEVVNVLFNRNGNFQSNFQEKNVDFLKKLLKKNV